MRQLAAVFVDCNDAVIACDLEGRITAWNRDAERMYGYAEAEALAMNIEQLVPPKLRPRTRALADRLRRGGTVDAWETRRVRKDGQVLDVRITVTSVRDNAGHTTAIVTTERDINERKQAREELERLVRDHTALLERTNLEQPAEASERKRADVKIEELLSSLGERVKELTALHQAARNLQDEAKSPAEVLREIAALLAGALQHPEVSAARVCWGEVEEATPGYHSTPWRMASGFTTADHREGTIEVVYLEERPPETEGPFLDEERNLINSLAEMVKSTLDRHLAKRALQESRDRIAAIVDTAAEGIITIDERGIVESYNKAAGQMFGYPAAEVIGRNIKTLMPWPYQQDHDSYLARDRKTDVKRLIGTGREVVGRHKDGSVFPVELAVSEFHDGGRSLFTGMVRDVSERKALEKEVLEIAAEEQRRIGQDLHDSVGQELTGLSLMAEDLAESLTEQSRREAELAGRITTGLKRTLGQVRALSRGLIPVDVDVCGLMAALSDLAARITEQAGVTCKFTCSEPVPIEDNVRATHLYRISQEAVTNALKHGRARNIDISLGTDGRNIVLKIRDDGDGIEDQSVGAKGTGLRTMHHRAGLINAMLGIKSAEQGGTVITCTLNRGGGCG